MSGRGRTGPSAPRVAQRHYLPDPVSALSPTPTLPACFVAPIGTERHKKASPEPYQGPSPEPEGEKAKRATKKKKKKGPWSTKSQRLAPTLLCSSLRPCFSFTFPNYPGTPCPFSIPLLSLRLQAKPARFSEELEEGSRKPFMVWEGDTGRIHFPSPQPAPGVQPRSTQSREQYPSFNHAYSIWHPFAYTPQANTAASRSDNKRIQRIWRATQDDLNAHTLLF